MNLLYVLPLLIYVLLITSLEANAQTISDLRIEPVVTNLKGCGVTFEFLPDGSIICGQLKGGAVQLIKNGSLIQKPLLRLNVYYVEIERGKGDERGLVGLEVDPKFLENHYIYLHWTYWDENDNASYRRIARFTLINNTLTDMKVLVDKIPAWWHHNGGPLEFGPDDKLYITGGDAAATYNSTRAQDINSLAGKILRIDRDGNIPEDNPFPNSPIYTIGHRNVFGIAFHPITGLPYISENGPKTTDELNILYKGKNYGWPIVLGMSNNTNFIDPIYVWELPIAPTEIIFYSGKNDKYSNEFTNDLFLLSYNQQALFRIELEEPNYDKVKSIVRYQLGFSDRVAVTDIEEGPDGYIYVSDFNAIWKLVPVYSNIPTSISLDIPNSSKVGDDIVIQPVISNSLGELLDNIPLNITITHNLFRESSLVTTKNGIAKYNFIPISPGRYIINVRFVGNDTYNSSEITKILQVKDADNLLESTIEGMKVKVLYNQPIINNSIIFIVKFQDYNTNELLNNVTYSFTLLKDGKPISLDSTLKKNGIDIYKYNLSDEALGPMRLEIGNINNTNNSISFDIVVVPEFEISITILIISFITLFILYMFKNNSRSYINLYKFFH